MNSYRNTLIIEDDPAVARSLIDSLEQANYHVVCRKNGQDGIAFARDRQPHLIILDVRLPDQSGFDVCRKIRQLNLRQPAAAHRPHHRSSSTAPGAGHKSRPHPYGFSFLTQTEVQVFDPSGLTVIAASGKPASFRSRVRCMVLSLALNRLQAVHVPIWL